MNKEKFNILWEKSYLPYVDYLKKIATNSRFNNEARDIIWQEYEETKSVLHTYMTDPDGKIDRHKVSAIIIFSILKIEPFKLVLPDNEKLKPIEVLTNEAFAFHCALSTLKSFIVTDAVLKNDEKRIKQFDDFIFPKCEHGDYSLYFIKSLYYSKKNKKVDIFSLANLLFMIEKYTELHNNNINVSEKYDYSNAISKIEENSEKLNKILNNNNIDELLKESSSDE
jgi:hypothetical protein